MSDNQSPNDDVVEIEVAAFRFQRQKVVSHGVITRGAAHIFACFSNPEGRIEGPKLAETVLDLMTLGYTIRTSTVYEDLSLLDFMPFTNGGMKVLA
jgi:hypothetical protein